jgi:hypothetical protein
VKPGKKQEAAMVEEIYDDVSSFLKGFSWDVSDQDTDRYVIGDQDGDRFYFGTAVLIIPHGGVRGDFIEEIKNSAESMIRDCDIFDWEGIPGIDRKIEAVTVKEYSDHIEIHLDWQTEHDYCADEYEAAHERAELERAFL